MATLRKDKGFLHEVGDMVVFTGESLRALPGLYRFPAEALRQGANYIRSSTLYFLLMTGFMGAAVTTFGYYFLRSAGAADYVGFFTGAFTPRALVPLMFGYVVSAKVGCGIVAELGAARIGQEIDAYESEGVDSVAFFVGTRIVGLLLFIPVAAGAGLISSVAAVYIDGVHILQALPSATLMNAHYGAQNITDNLLAVVQMGTMAVVVVLVSCYYGYNASGGPAGIGKAVATSFLVNLVLVHFISGFYVNLFYSKDLGLPIGG